MAEAEVQTSHAKGLEVCAKQIAKCRVHTSRETETEFFFIIN